MREARGIENLRSQAVTWWHASLRTVAVLNATLWVLAAIAVSRLPVANDAAAWQLLLSAGYVAGCAFRSLLPVVDIPRLVLVDSRLSSVFIGRSVATVAELCFAAQWALLLSHVARLSGNSFAQLVSLAVLPLILLAEGFSWYAVLTTRQRAHAVENSLWGISAALVVAAMLVIGPHALAPYYVPTVVGGAAYVAFIFIYDVPMYWSRWLADQASGRKYLSVAGGLVEVRLRWAVSHRLEDWKNEIPWMSLYFTFGVWSSIWLVLASIASAQ
jgi:hypothetical protein